MGRPTPRWTGKGWEVDLRKPWGLGRHRVEAPPPPPGELEATHEAYALLARLERERPQGAQLSLPATAGRTIGQLLTEWIEKRGYRRGGSSWVRETAARVQKELGHVALAEICGPRGWEILGEWRTKVRETGYPRHYAHKTITVVCGAATMRDRLSVLRGAFEWAADPKQRYMPFVPNLPDARLHQGEVYYTPREEWIDEPTFRAVRDAIYCGPSAAATIESAWRRYGTPWPGCTIDDFIARRRLFLSWSFYSGMREQDVAAINDLSVSADFGFYWPFGRKTSDEEGDPEKMPDPLRADLEYERRRLGRTYFRGEPVTGGPWPRVCEVLRAACRKAGVPPFDVMTLRHSFAYHKALSGKCDRDQTARLMHLQTSALVRRVYNNVTPARCRDEAGAAWPEMRTRAPGTGSARILPLSAHQVQTKAPEVVAPSGIAKRLPKQQKGTGLNARNVK